MYECATIAYKVCAQSARIFTLDFRKAFLEPHNLLYNFVFSFMENMSKQPSLARLQEVSSYISLHDTILPYHHVLLLRYVIHRDLLVSGIVRPLHCEGLK